MITLSDIEKVTGVLKDEFGNVKPNESYGWPNTALNILDCVLSLNRRYEEVVKPRVKYFATKNPECKTVNQLRKLIEAYNCNYGEFTNSELNYNHADRGRIIHELCQYLLMEITPTTGTSEEDKLKTWAENARPGDAYFLGIKGFGLSGFQYLRMLFGAQTIKPDVHIMGYISKIIEKPITDIQALYILEKAAIKNKLPLRELDSEIWQKRNDIK